MIGSYISRSCIDTTKIWEKQEEPEKMFLECSEGIGVKENLFQLKLNGVLITMIPHY